MISIAAMEEFVIEKIFFEPTDGLCDWFVVPDYVLADGLDSASLAIRRAIKLYVIECFNRGYCSETTPKEFWLAVRKHLPEASS